MSEKLNCLNVDLHWKAPGSSGGAGLSHQVSDSELSASRWVGGSGSTSSVFPRRGGLECSAVNNPGISKESECSGSYDWNLLLKYKVISLSLYV